jgi:hypothetical protein
MEEILEAMYEDLGSKWISTCVTDSYSYYGIPHSTKCSMNLQKLINDRALIILHDGVQNRMEKDLKPDSLKILKKMVVESVDGISIIRKLEANIKNETTTCCISKTGYNLLIGPDFDFFDVGK